MVQQPPNVFDRHRNIDDVPQLALSEKAFGDHVLNQILDLGG
ncbi:MAG: hypothetical protein V9E99_10330 [Microthrixaceae bacterium]